jgi:hypothetical protein
LLISFLKLSYPFVPIMKIKCRISVVISFLSQKKSFRTGAIKIGLSLVFVCLYMTRFIRKVLIN